MNQGYARIWVHLALMATMLAWALNVTAIKWLAGVTDVMLVAGLRIFLACVTLLLLLAFTGQRFPRWRGRKLVFACITGLLLVYANQAFFATAMDHTSATNASLILALNPLLVAVMEGFFFGKRVTRNFAIGNALALAGVTLVILNRPGASWVGPALGDLLVLASMFSFACGGAALQRLGRNSSTLAINSFFYLVGSLGLVLHAAILVEAPMPQLAALEWYTWLVIGFSGVIATALGAAAWGKGVAVLGMGGAGVYMSWVPVLGVATAALLLDEQVTQWHLLGMLGVFAGTALSFYPARKTVPAGL